MTLEPCTNRSAIQMVGMDAPSVKSGHGNVALCQDHRICGIMPHIWTNIRTKNLRYKTSRF